MSYQPSATVKLNCGIVHDLCERVSGPLTGVALSALSAGEVVRGAVAVVTGVTLNRLAPVLRRWQDDPPRTDWRAVTRRGTGIDAYVLAGAARDEQVVPIVNVAAQLDDFERYLTTALRAHERALGARGLDDKSVRRQEDKRRASMSGAVGVGRYGNWEGFEVLAADRGPGVVEVDDARLKVVREHLASAAVTSAEIDTWSTRLRRGEPGGDRSEIAALPVAIEKLVAALDEDLAVA